MIKILPLEEDTGISEPFYQLVVTIGYGEHCDDTYTQNCLEINDEKAVQYNNLTEEEIEEMDLLEFMDLTKYITTEDAERIVKLVKSILGRETSGGYVVNHIVLNDGPDDFWWKECCEMTDEEFKSMEDVCEKYENSLFSPKVDHNWYGITDAQIVYYDENDNKHRCEVI